MKNPKKFGIALGLSIISFSLTILAIYSFGTQTELNPFFRNAFEAGATATAFYFTLRWSILFGLVKWIESVQPNIGWHYNIMIAIFGLDALNNLIRWGLYAKTYI